MPAQPAGACGRRVAQATVADLRDYSAPVACQCPRRAKSARKRLSTGESGRRLHPLYQRPEFAESAIND